MTRTYQLRLRPGFRTFLFLLSRLLQRRTRSFRFLPWVPWRSLLLCPIINQDHLPVHHHLHLLLLRLLKPTILHDPLFSSLPLPPHFNDPMQPRQQHRRARKGIPSHALTTAVTITVAGRTPMVARRRCANPTDAAVAREMALVMPITAPHPIRTPDPAP